MTDLVDFLHARYDERERTAKAARSEEWSVEPYQPTSPGAVPASTWLVTGPEGEDGVAVVNGSYRADHMALNDPAAALADVAVKRRILDEVLGWGHNEEQDSWYSCSQATDPYDSTPGSACADDERAGKPCDCGLAERQHRILSPLGSEFVGHPDYQKGWAP